MSDKKKQTTLSGLWAKKGGKTSGGGPGRSSQKLTVTKIQTGWLMDAVRHIKAQKQRPDRDRICHYIQQHHDLTTKTVSLLLDSAVREKILTTTITRNNTDKLTYVIVTPGMTLPPAGVARAQPATSKSKPAAATQKAAAAESDDEDKKVNLHNKSDISSLMVRAVKALRDTAGSSLNDIAEYILTSCNVELNSGVDLIRLVKLSARQAVRKSLLVKSKGNLYKIPRGARKAVNPKQQDTSSKTGKEKPKVIPICSFCLGDEKKNASKQPEDMVSCCRCGQSGHPSCLKFSDSQTEVVKAMSDWECYDCKKCTVCQVSRKNDNDMLICDRCDRSFHPHCCKPPVKKPPDGTWMCHICVNGKDPKRKSSTKGKEDGGISSSKSTPLVNGKLKWGQIRRKYEFKRACETPGCDGSGNINSKMSNHRRQASCPLLTKEERRRLKRERKDSGSDAESKDSSLVSSNDLAAEHSSLKGLTDGLSQFFTPSDKRTSRVSMSSMLTAASKQPVKQPKSATTTSQAAANRLVKKSKLVQRGKAKTSQKGNNNNNNISNISETNRSLSASSSTFSLSEHINSLPGANQLKGLVDGMSRFFTPTGERKKSMPIYMPPARKRKDTDKSTATRSGAEESDGAGLLSDEGKSDGDVVDSIDKANLPECVSTRDYQLFRKAQRDAKEPGSVGILVKPVIEHGKRYPPVIEFGKFEIQTWYSSPYPQEYAQLPKLYICEFCLKYMKSRSILVRHMDKCGLTNPPANEIYRKDNLSVFEVDGNANKIYCQNLCLLAKLFLDHKTLYYDVEPFLFYVLTCNDEDGCHFVGYFSKEKQCQQKYNVSCITTLPQHQRKGYGKFLIDFSYLLSRKEGNPGSPEKPLSELGKISYKSYWKCAIIQHLHDHSADPDLTIKGISAETGMCAHDIASTLQELNMIEVNTAGEVVVAVDHQLISDHMARLKRSSGRQYVIDEEHLRWTPLVNKHASSSSPEKSSPEKPSPLSLMRERRQTQDVELEPEPVKSPPPRRVPVSSRRASFHRAGASSLLTSSTTAKPEAGTRSRESSPQHSLGSPKPVTRSSPAPGANKMNKRCTRKLTNANGPVLANGIISSTLRRRQSQLSSSDEDEDMRAKPKPHPPKKRRGSCREEKLSRRKSGSPSTPEKKNRYSCTRSSTLRSQSRSGRQSSGGSRHNGSEPVDGVKRCTDHYFSDDNCSGRSEPAPCYDASASDIDSGNSEMELSSNESAQWTPTMPRACSDSGSVNDERVSSRLSFDQTAAEAPVELLAPVNIEMEPKPENQNEPELGAESKHSESSLKKVISKEELPLPQSYPPNCAPEIDPATLCFESPVSLNSNDTSLNGSQPIEQTVSQPISNRSQSHYEYTDTAQQVPAKNVQSNVPQQPDTRSNNACNIQQPHLDTYMDDIASITADQSASTAARDYQQQQHCFNDQQQHSSPSNMQHQQNPMYPPNQSPQVIISNSPHMAPQSPQVQQKSPLMHPNSPHIPVQSPHFPHSGPMLSPGPQHSPYNPRCRTGSMSKVTPADLTPPPCTPSPSKHTPPDRYQQYHHQARVAQKSPNITMNSREMRYNASNTMPPLLNHNMPNMNNGGYAPPPQQTLMNGGQHFFPANQYLDSNYFNSYQMQLAPAAAPGVYNNQLQAGNTAAAGMYRYQ